MPTECKRLEQLLKRMVPVLLNWASSLKELSIAGLASQSEYWSVPSNQDLRQAGFILGRGCVWVLRGGQGYKWALLLSLVSGALRRTWASSEAALW